MSEKESYLVIVLRSQQRNGKQIFRPVHTTVADSPPVVLLEKSMADLVSIESGAAWRDWEDVVENEFALVEDWVVSGPEAARGESV